MHHQAMHHLAAHHEKDHHLAMQGLVLSATSQCTPPDSVGLIGPARSSLEQLLAGAGLSCPFGTRVSACRDGSAQHQQYCVLLDVALILVPYAAQGLAHAMRACLAEGVSKVRGAGVVNGLRGRGCQAIRLWSKVMTCGGHWYLPGRGHGQKLDGRGGGRERPSAWVGGRLGESRGRVLGRTVVWCGVIFRAQGWGGPARGMADCALKWTSSRPHACTPGEVSAHVHPWTAARAALALSEA